MATYVEMVYPRTRECVVLADGVVVERYVVDHCDKCDKWKRADREGFQTWFGEKLMWICAECRR
jgi:hypothetical protein